MPLGPPPLFMPDAGSAGLMLDEPDGKHAIGIAYDAISAPDAARLFAAGILRREHLFTSAAFSFLQEHPSADFTVSTECFYDETESWWGIVRAVRLGNDAEINPTVLAAFAGTISKKADGLPIVQSVMIMLHNAQGGHCTEAFDYRAQTLADHPSAHLMFFSSHENL